MAKAKQVAAKPQQPAAPLDPNEGLAKELYDLDTWKKSGEVAAKLRRHEELRKLLQVSWKETQRNAPWSGSGWQVFFVQQQGKSKSVCGLPNCGNLGLRNQPEWHMKCQTMVEPPKAA